jgi:hypothetical protein
MRFSLAVGLTLVVAPPVVAQRNDFEFHRELSPGSRFVLRNIIGDVRLEGTSGRTLEVTAIKKAGRHGDPQDVEIRSLDLSGGGVAVCVYYPGQYARGDRGDRSERSERRERVERRERTERNDRSDRDDRAARRKAEKEDRDDDEDDDQPRNRHNTRHDHDDDVCNRDHGWNGNNRNDTAIEFLVRVPSGLKLDTKTVSGDVRGKGLRGELDIGTVSGDVRLADLEAGSLDAASVSGEIELDRVRARDVSAETVSGNVTYVGDIDSQGSYNFKTLSGDVVVTVPRQPNAQLSAVTFSGDFRSDFPTQTDPKRRRHRYNATWGSGSARIDLESFSGDIAIRSKE